MTIRPATDHDIPAIVELLKLSLGETLMPKSEAFWRWKHIDNPFGRSPVLLAFENEVLIGVRAFMRWEWQSGDKILKAVRAVDTATHPNHQGKGIFKRLTLELIEQFKSEGVDFIFNTPNKNSQPGYLKMGWQSIGRMPIQVKLHLIKNRDQKRISDNWDNIDQNPLWKLDFNTHRLRTRVSPEYLLWRYRDNPAVKYNLLSMDRGNPFILLYREKIVKGITEMRITEVICESKNLGYAIRALRSIAKAPSFISSSGCMQSLFPSGFIKLKMGPEVTVKNLNNLTLPQNLNFTNWSPSLGDLELF